MTSRPRILSISFSDIAADARVLRQAQALQHLGDVTTCSYGEAVPGVAHHLQIPTGLPSLPQTPAGVAMLAARRWERSERSAPAVAAAGALLAGHLREHGRFDLVVGNDARALPLAFDAATPGPGSGEAETPVWADMHEYAPHERIIDWRWRLLVSPLMTHLCRTYLPRAAAVTTIGPAIAGIYAEEFGVRPEVVRSAPAPSNLSPTPVTEGRIRLVHSGGAVPGRNLEGLIQITRALDQRFSLDLYLVSAQDGGRYLQQLHDLAAGDPRITFHPPVRPHELPATLNAYDLGIFFMPPQRGSINMTYTLPNKFFDFVQGRLGVVVGPMPEMAALVREHDLGVVSDTFEVADMAARLAALDTAAVGRFKAASDTVAPEFSSDRDVAVIHSLVRRLLDPATAQPS